MERGRGGGGGEGGGGGRGGGGAQGRCRQFVCVLARARALRSIKQFYMYTYMLPTVQTHRCPTRQGPAGTGQSMEVVAVVDLPVRLMVPRTSRGATPVACPRTVVGPTSLVGR